MRSITRLCIPAFVLFTVITAAVTAGAAPSEETHQTAVSASTQVPPAHRIDINSASLTDLRSLPGVGTARAKQLVAGRPYSSIDEIKTRKLMSQRAYDKIRDRIKVERNAGTGGGERQGIATPRTKQP